MFETQVVLEETQTSPEELDLILFATVTPDMPVPSAASYVQKNLGAGNSWGYDINGGCTGFVCALTTGAQFIESGRHQKVLVIGADKMSSIIDYTDRNTCGQIEMGHHSLIYRFWGRSKFNDVGKCENKHQNYSYNC